MKHLFDLFRYGFGKPDDPIYKRDSSGWLLPKFSNFRQRGCAPLVAVTVMGTAATCACMAMPLTVEISRNDAAGALFLLAAAVIAGVYLSGEIIMRIGGMLIGAVAAVSISAEVENETLVFLRTTPKPEREIVLAKFGAVLKQMRPVMWVPLATRLFTLIAVPIYATLLIGYLLWPAGNMAGVPAGSPPPVVGPEVTPVLPDTLGSGWIIALVGGGFGAVMWLLLYLLQPLRSALFMGALGLLASSLTKTRTVSLLAIGGLFGLMWAVSYALIQVYGLGLSLVLNIGGAVGVLDVLNALFPPEVRFGLGAGLFGLWNLGSLVVHLGLVLLMLNWATRALRRLPYGR